MTLAIGMSRTATCVLVGRESVVRRLAAGDSDQDNGDHECEHRGLQPFRLGNVLQAREFDFLLHVILQCVRGWDSGVDSKPSPQSEHHGRG